MRPNISWKTRKVESYFPLIDKNDFQSSVISKRDCFVEMKATIQLRAWIHYTTLERTLSIALYSLPFQKLSKKLRKI